MGSSSSSHVKNIHLEQKTRNSDSTKSAVNGQRQGSAKQRSFRNSKVSNETETAQVIKTDEKHSEDENKTTEKLEKLLVESESQRLDLEDRVQSLEEQLEYYKNQNLITEEKTCNETLHAKDQYIAKLEKEKADLETESNKVTQRNRKKIKQLSSKLSEYKQEANFQMMELHEEINRLKEENMSLQGEHKAVASSEVSGLENVPGGGKMKLILELSAQVTEQNDKISKLERKLEDKNQIIEELRVKLKNNMQYLKARNEVDNHRNVSNDKNNNNSFINRSYSNSKSQSRKTAESQRKTESTNNDVNSLFAVTEEDSDNDFDENDKMEKLTALLKGVKAKNDKLRQSTDTLDDEKLSDKDDLQSTEKQNEGDLRMFSGTSRDSGLGSAGKQRKTIQKITVTNQEQREPSFSLESGLSDSDLDDYRNNGHSKITSAPPMLERNFTGQKLKKKSSLKRRVSQKKERNADKPNIPKPTLAFVNSGSVMTDENIFKIPGSSSLSSVQVS